MGGGATQLSLRGSQDKYLHFDADHSFFQPVHIPYEDFALETMEITAQGQVAFDRQATYTILSNAELITGASLEIILPALPTPAGGGVGENIVAWCHSIGIYILERLEFKAQSQILDPRYPQFMDAWARLSVPDCQREGFNDLIGELNLTTRFVAGTTVNSHQVDPTAPQVLAATKPQVRLMVPLDFWWCQSWSQALPIGILLYTNIQLTVKFRAAAQCYITGGAGALLAAQPSLVDAKLLVDYVYLDEAARNRIARQAQFYVFKQIQHHGGFAVNQSTANYKLPFVMPVCELLWMVQEDDAVVNNVRRFDWYDRYNGNTATYYPDAPITQVTLKINSQDRLQPRDGLYHNRYQPFKHHTCIPSSRGIYMYSFALKPEHASAEGALNISRSENNYLNLTFNQDGGDGIGNHAGLLYVFAVNYNYIYIENGYLTMLYNA